MKNGCVGLIYNIFWRGGGIVDSINKYRKFNFLM